MLHKSSIIVPGKNMKNLIRVTTFRLARHLFLVLFSTSITYFIVVQSYECKDVGDCGCQFTNKSGNFIISMKGISHRYRAYVTGVKDAKGDSWTYSIDPCYGFYENTGCQDVAMCQISTDQTDFIPVASPDIESYGDYEEGKPLQVIYKTRTHNEVVRQLIINLNYGVNEETSTVLRSKLSSNVHRFTRAVKYTLSIHYLTNLAMTSFSFMVGQLPFVLILKVNVMHAFSNCAKKTPFNYTYSSRRYRKTVNMTSSSLRPNGNATQPSSGSSSSGSGDLSTGSVVVMSFFGLVVVYLVAGMLFMKYGRGASGKKVIPNIDFWSSLLGLVKDGCVFSGKKVNELCGRCCQSIHAEGYEEIN